jgi:hypothetical protein
MKTRSDWPTAMATTRAIMCGSISPPERKKRHPSFNPHGTAHIG